MTARVLHEIGCLATCRPGGGQGEVHAVRDAALAWSGDEILWAGPGDDLPGELADAPRLDAGGRTVVPGLVDCHTHVAFGGWRADEFSRRLRGATYAEIAREGGGIASTVRATRASTERDLADRARGFLREMASLGVTTVEAKSGYGLTLEEELKLLRVYRRLGAGGGPAEGLPRLVPTFLGAHVLPREHAGDRGRYVDLVVEEWIPEVADRGLARFCDVFLEEGAFRRDEARRILRAGREHGLGAKLHADQMTEGGGAALAAEVGAASADHLEAVSPEGIEALAGSGVVAVTLPLATLYLDQEPPPARAMIDAGVPVAVATDFNPGTAPSYHLPFAMTLACVRQRMTPAEVLKGATIHAARAVGEAGEVGSLEPGKRADFAVVDAPDPEGWLYHLRPNACLMTVRGGEVIWRAGGAGGAPLPGGRVLPGGPRGELA